MAVKNNFRNISVLLVLGVILLIYGLSSSYITLSMGRLATSFLILGAASLIICFIRIRNLSPQLTSTSRWKKYVLFALLIILWSALYFEVNLFVYQHNKRWDLTLAKQHTLIENTREIISDLHQEIRITAFFVGLPPKYLEDLLNEE